MSPISYITDEHTAILTLNNPPANALGQAVLTKLAEYVDAVADDHTVKVAVVTSPPGKFFCAGADIKELAGIKSREQAAEYAWRGQSILSRLEHAGKPFIAAVEGICVGGGCELALACHLRVAGAEAQFGLPEINLGIMPGFGGTRRLARLTGHARALEIMLTGKMLSASDALAAGLVNQTVKPGAALDTALSLARQLQEKSHPAVAAILAAVRDRNAAALDEQEARLFGELFGKEDSKEGIKAFLEKRTPKFRDR